jgi:hypothetical protein
MPPGDFAWVPFGPADPEGNSAWYRALEEGKCAQVTNDANSTLVQAAAAICRAVIDKQRSEWDTAQQLVNQGLKGSGAAACLDNAATAMIQRALAWHASHPDADPTVNLPTAGQPVACEFKVTKVEPAQGPLAGGTKVEITGPGLNEVESVSFGGVQTQVQEHHTTQVGGATVDVLTVTTPAGKQPGPVDVSVKNRAGVAVAPGAFTYTSGAASPSPARSPSPSPTGPTVSPTAPASPTATPGGTGSPNRPMRPTRTFQPFQTPTGQSS